MTSERKELAPSLLSADFTDLRSAARMIREGGAGLVHLDVMDGHFVPNLTFGPPVIRSFRQITDLVLDVHLMIENPERSLADYLQAGAGMISVHVEAAAHLHRTVSRIREGGARPGVALNPATSLATITEILPWVDFVLLMSVNPGFGGQAYIPTTTDKIRRLAAEIRDRRLDVAIEVDGGIGLHNIAELVAAGVNIAVAGAAVFGSHDPVAAIRSLRQAML